MYSAESNNPAGPGVTQQRLDPRVREGGSIRAKGERGLGQNAREVREDCVFPHLAPGYTAAGMGARPRTGSSVSLPCCNLKRRSVSLAS
jgi:hypothetical protein